MNIDYLHQVDIGGGVRLANITIAEACMMCEQFLKRVYQIRNAVDDMQYSEVITDTSEFNQIETCIRLIARVTEQCESDLIRCESHINSLKHIMPIRLDIPAGEIDRIKGMLSQMPVSLQLGGD